MASPNVVVFLPGILGSELKLGAQLVWPGTPLEYVAGYKRMDQLVDSATVAGDIIRNFGPLHQYDTLIDDLGQCGFNEAGDPATLYVCPYDWRKDNADAAVQLADLLDKAAADHKGAANIALVAHSMGGLVARYYLEAGAYKKRPAFASITQLITLGTPHRGAALALAAALGRVGRLFLNAEQVKQLASDKRYPSLYQLLPTRGEPFAWNEDAAADFASIDVFADEVAAALSLSSDNLASALAFQKSLSLQGRPAHVRYFSFYGTEQRTITTIGLLPWKDTYRPREIQADRGGDETVPVWSAAIDGIQGFPVGGAHGTIFRDATLRRMLAGLLGKKGVLAAVAPEFTLVVLESVAPPTVPLHIQLSLDAPSEAVRGALQFARIPIDATGKEGVPVTFGAPIPIRYDGGLVQRIDLVATSPAYAGFYEARFVSDEDGTVKASDRLIVQA